ncbi:hypothetical protein BH10PSE18_BH10PSE18_17910 [soil metagenome]
MTENTVPKKGRTKVTRAITKPAVPSPAPEAVSPPTLRPQVEDGEELVADEDAKIGTVVRSERHKRSWSLGQLSEAANISIGMLSQIERGLATPSLKTLRLLAAALEVPIIHFFDASAPDKQVSPFIVRAGERHCMDMMKSTGINKMFLMPPGTGLLEMWEFRFAPGGSSGGALYNHQGEKAGLVLSGRIRLWLGEESFVLEEGDSFRFASMMKHRIENDFPEEARVVWVITPPTSGSHAPARQ